MAFSNGKLHRLAPWKGHPRGVCCPRGVKGPEIVYSPDRLLYPLKRVGSRGAGEFERVGWDEALDGIAESLQRIKRDLGPEAACVYTGRGTFERSLCDQMTPAGVRTSSAWSLLYPFGSVNSTGVGAICYVSHGVIAPATTFGIWRADMAVDLEQSDLVVVWGANPATDSGPSEYVRVKQAAERGAAVVVVDHRRTQTVRATGGRWLGVRPGTDGALALGMLHVVIEERLYDAEFVRRWTYGFEELRAYVQGFTPERVEAITGVAAEEVRRLARQLVRARGASLVMQTGLEYADSGTQNIRAVLALWALTGNLDVPGGLNFAPEAEFPVGQSHRLEAPDGPDPIGKDRYPLYHLYRREAHSMELPRAILENDPYPVRGMLVVGSSIITSYPNPDLWRRCFESLDLLVTVDRFMTADSLYADYVLPAATLFEVESYEIFGRIIQLRQQLMEPQGESRSDWQIASELAGRLGYGELFPASSREVVERALEGTGITYQQLAESPDGVALPGPAARYRKWELGLLRQDGQPGFPTPTGRIELTSTVLERYGYDPLPIFTEPREGPISSPETAQRYPLVFNSGARIHSDFRSQHHNIPGLLRMQADPRVWLHPRDAEARGIASGDHVFVLSPRGKVPYRAFVTEDIVPGVVEANGGGGSPIATEPWRRCNVNELTDFENTDPISGFPVYKALLCDVVPAPSQELVPGQG